MLLLVSIILLLSVYIKSFLNKLLDLNGTYQIIIKKNIPLPLFATGFAVLGQMFGIIAILNQFTLKKEELLPYSILGIHTLILFTILSTYYFHNIFKDKTQINHFMKNISLIGGLLLVKLYIPQESNFKKILNRLKFF
jgi:putative oxidoreductase